MTELNRRKHDLTGKLKRVVEKEDKVNALREFSNYHVFRVFMTFVADFIPRDGIVDDLDRRVGSIGDQTASFEKTIRTLKGEHQGCYSVAHFVSGAGLTPIVKVTLLQFRMCRRRKWCQMFRRALALR